MPTDDQLLAQLRAALEPEQRAVDPERIEALRAAAATRSGSIAPVAGSGRAQGPPWLALAAVAAVAAAVAAFVLGGVLLGRPDEPADGDLLAGGTLEFESTLTTPSGDAAATATGIMTGIGRIVQVRTDALPILPKGDFYELWFLGPGDSRRSPNRISAGTFHPDEAGRSHIDLTAAVDPKLYPKLSGTAEPGDGNPLPTGPEVLRADIELNA